MNVEEIQRAVCSSLCADVRVTRQEGDLLHVVTPFLFPDGDSYSIYLERVETGGFRVTDLGGTLMHLSYDNDISKLREGSRGRVFHQILAELDLKDDDGELFMDCPGDELGRTIFRFGQALTRVHDLTFLNRVRVESTFYEDLFETLASRLPRDKIYPNYAVPGLPDAANYLVDFYVNVGAHPGFIFGVTNVDKARLTTITLQHLNAKLGDIHSLVVFQNFSALPSRDVGRLINAANDMVASLDATEALDRKLRLMA